MRHRTIGDEGIIVHQGRSEVLVVNEVGARIVDLLDVPASVQTLVDALAAEYEVERTLLEQDVAGYLDELAAAGVVEAHVP